MDLDGEDSVIARVASLSVNSAASVWTILKPGFVRWDIALAGADGKGTKRQLVKPRHCEREEDPSSPVGEEAWTVLEWLVSLFERDAEMTEKEGKREFEIPSSPDVTFLLASSTAFPIAYHSPLLLLTIPGTGDDGPRWDAGAIVDVVLFCLPQRNKQHKAIGVRLLSQVRGNHSILLSLGAASYHRYSTQVGQLDVYDALRPCHVRKGIMWSDSHRGLAVVTNRA